MSDTISDRAREIERRKAVRRGEASVPSTSTRDDSPAVMCINRLTCKGSTRWILNLGGHTEARECTECGIQFTTFSPAVRKLMAIGKTSSEARAILDGARREVLREEIARTPYRRH